MKGKRYNTNKVNVVNKILKNGLLIIIVISVMTYLIMGLTSIYRNNIN